MAISMGKGIIDLLASVDDERNNEKNRILHISISKIKPNPNQPRKTFNEKSIEELSQSIKENGIIQPLVVKMEKGNFVIIAGERRYRAAKLAGISELPVIVREMSQQKTKEISLIENLQRENLNVIEEAEAMKELIDRYGMTQEILAKNIGKARPSIANIMRLLLLDEKVKKLVRENKLSAGHARTLIPITDEQKQQEFAKKAIDQNMSVRQLEKEVRYFLNPEKAPKKMSEEKKEKISREAQEMVDYMKRLFSTRVKLVGNDEKGRITIDYFTRDDLQRIYEILNLLKK